MSARLFAPPPPEGDPYAPAGRFFKDYDPADWDPLTLACSYNDHPDTVLRELGLIAQGGTRRWKPCTYHPRKKVWEYDDTQHIAQFQEEQVGNRRDTVPNGIVRIVGGMVNHDFKPDAKSAKKRDQNKTLLNQLAAFAHRKRGRGIAAVKGVLHDVQKPTLSQPRQPAGLGGTLMGRLRTPSVVPDDTTSQRRDGNNNNKRVKTAEELEAEEAWRLLLDSDEEEPEDINQLVDAADDEPQYISGHELGKYLKQYLTRSIPMAAKKVGAVVLYTGTDDLAKHLAVGVNGMAKTTHVVGSERVTQFSVLGVNPNQDRDIVQHGATKYFTHHVLVKELPDLPGHIKKQLQERREKLPLALEDTAGVLALNRREDNYRAKVEADHRRSCALSYTTTLVDWLSKGYSKSDKLASRQGLRRPPPDREKVPVCTILIGGTPTDKFQLRKNVDNGWPILVLEGSGGLADVLATTMRRVDELSGQAGVDDYRQHTARIESVIADILNNGKLILIRKGTQAEEMQRTIENSLKGDETLTMAWKKYASWTHNATEQEFLYKAMQLAMLILQIAATAMAIWMTFLLLFKGSTQQPTDDPDAPAWFQGLWVAMQCTVIGLPIVVTLIQALQNKLNPGAKWVTLMTQAAALQKEIYLYRTKTRGYSSREIRKAITGEDTKERYRSRAELLHLRMKQFTEELAASEVSSITLKEYTGALPPREVAQHGDDGFSALSPDEYVKVRLEPSMQQYIDWSKAAGRSKTSLTICIYVFGALGTGFAALAAYLLGAFQAFVALTTALVNALTRYLDYTRLEWLQKKYNKTYKQLSNVQTIWKSKGASDDTLQARNQLVGTAEDVIVSETREKATQLGDAIEQAKEMNEEMEKDREAALNKLQSGEEDEKVKKLKNLGLESLGPDTLRDALTNPRGPAAESLKNTLVQLNKDLGDVVAPLVEVAAETEIGKKVIAEGTEKLGEAMEVAGEIRQKAEGVIVDIHKAAMGLSDWVPDNLKGLLSDAREREKFLRDIQTPEGRAGIKRMGYNTILHMAKQSKTALFDRIQSMPQRQVFEVTKRLMVEEITHHFFDPEILKDIALLEVVPDPEQLEHFLSEFRSLAMAENVEGMSFSNVLNMVKDRDLKKKLIALGSEKCQQLVLRSVSIFQKTEDSHPALNALDSIARSIAELDVEELLSNKLQGVKIWKTLEDVKALGNLQPEMLPKADLLNMFPSTARQKLLNKSQFQLACYLRMLSFGTPASRVWESFVQKCGGFLPTRFIKSMQADPEVKERFVLSNQTISQLHINSMRKAALLKMLRTAPVFDERVGGKLEILEESELKVVLSAIQATISNSYSGRMVDRLADSVTTFDVNSVVGVEDRDKLVSKIREFDGANIRQLTKRQILTSLGYKRLVTTFSQLEEPQLQEMLYKLKYIMSNTFQMRTFGILQERIGEVLRKHYHRVRFWDMEFIDHLVNNVDDEIVLRLALYKTSDELLSSIGDVHLSHGLVGFKLEELRQVFRGIHDYAGERVLSNVFEAVSLDLDTSLEEAYDKVFHLPANREVCMMGMCRVAQCSFEDLRTTPVVRLRNTLGFPSGAVSDFFDSLSDQDVRRIIFALLSELTCSLPYRLFIKTCNQIHTYDLRDVVTDPPDRYKVTPWVFDILQNPEMEQYMVVTGGRLTLTCTRGQVLRIADDMENKDEITHLLRVLTETQLKLLFVKMYEWFHKTAVGNFYHHFEKTRKVTGARLYMDRLVEEATSSLKSKAKMKPQEMLQVFDGFDASVFCQKPFEEKQKVLSQLVEDDEVVGIIATYDETELRKFFSHIYASSADLTPLSERLEISRMRVVAKLQHSITLLSGAAAKKQKNHPPPAPIIPAFTPPDTAPPLSPLQSPIAGDTAANDTTDPPTEEETDAPPPLRPTASPAPPAPGKLTFGDRELSEPEFSDDDD